MSVKCTGELGAMAIKNDAKIEQREHDLSVQN